MMSIISSIKNFVCSSLSCCSTTQAINKFGYIPDLPDKRDFYFKQLMSELKLDSKLPDSVDLRPQMPPVLDQGNLGSCTANGSANAHFYDQIKQSGTGWCPSRLFIYYNERVIEGTVNSDSGATIRDAVKSMAKWGVCKEKQWPYINIEKKFRKKPQQFCYINALQFKALKYFRVNQNRTEMQTALAAGFPIIIGFSVYESFESDAVASTGIVPMPGPDEQLLGGHCVLIVGFDNAKQQYICMNSWGTSWGANGFFFIPYQYLEDPDLASDFWVLQLVKEKKQTA